METGFRDVLIVVDVQRDFCPGGALAVPAGDEVVEVIQRIAPRFAHVVLTQDWHPEGHLSFASSHAGRVVFEEVELPYGRQTLWPAHCVQGTAGAEFHPGLDTVRAEMILRKGFRREIDSYSAFFENDRVTGTGLDGYMRARGLERAFFVGLAYDYCVGWSAVDARRCGFESVVIRDGCRAIDLGGTVARMEADFRESEVVVISSEEL